MKTVLIFPKPEWERALLREGICGQRPPIAYRNINSPDGKWHDNEVSARLDAGAWSPSTKDVRRAIPIAWNDHILNEGVDRVIRIVNDERISVGLKPVYWLCQDYGDVDDLISSVAPMVAKIGECLVVPVG